ncbi:hypothetical protein JR316_0001314 [Psilocybe cubensis]|uniref:Uncharacterized protein n=2 Tax=Psilocybe cubensis TaxID=181762 RepID=A0ACB8HHQ0_PSICU|nr:hypothetical protein JR316_0001314 [Psilocybe cubensis]KAH9487245.1 hypothetical protein JR316_0001314 [Psilocybe cubensis]
MDANDPFSPYLEEALNYKADPLPRADGRPEPLKPKRIPLTFHDRHLSPNLTCRRVVEFPQIAQILSQVTDKSIAYYLAHKKTFPVDGFSVLPKESLLSRIGTLDDARNMNIRYKRTAGHFSSLLASHLFYAGPMPWTNLFELVWQYTENDFSSESTLNLFPERLVVNNRDSEPIAPNVQSVAPENRDTMPYQVRALHDAQNIFPHVALWHFLPPSPTGMMIVRRISSGIFLWETSGTKGLKNMPDNSVPEDAGRSLWDPKLNNLKTRPPFRNSGIVKKPRHITIPRKADKSVNSRVDVDQYIQHAWARAVETDSTFIVINCGVYERIGIRHRASQTLFISPLIDPTKCNDPAYGKLHIGLYIAIAEDMIDRFIIQSKRPPQVSRTLPDVSPDQEGPTHNSVHSSHNDLLHDNSNINDSSSITREIREREVALITLKYGVYCSPVPATFLRVQLNPSTNAVSTKTKFLPHECLELVLDQPFENVSAKKSIHNAKLLVTLNSGEVLHRKLVVKLAFSHEQRQELQNEYMTYKHMSQFEEIEQYCVPVHGLFEDQDSDTLAMVMDYGGISLRHLYQLYPALNLSHPWILELHMSTASKLRHIHAKGVRHRNLSPDKILIGEGNKTKIVGFGRAVVSVTDSQQSRTAEEEGHEKFLFDRELERLWAAFGGWHNYPEFWDPDYS